MWKIESCAPKAMQARPMSPRASMIVAESRLHKSFERTWRQAQLGKLAQMGKLPLHLLPSMHHQ